MSNLHIMKLFLLAVLFIAGMTVTSMAGPALIITQKNLADRVRSQNPHLAAARLRIDEAVGRLKQSGRLSNPTLNTSFKHNTAFREGELEIGFSQRFPLTDRLQRAREVSLTEVKAAEAEVREIERQLIARARLLVVKALSIHQQRGLYSEQSSMVEKFADDLAEAAKRGEISSLDAGQAKLETATVALEMRQLDAAETAALGELRPLLGMRASEGLQVSGQLAPLTGPIPFRGVEARPDYQLSKLEAKAAEQSIALEKARRIDDIEAGIFAAGERSEDAPDGFENEAIVGFALKIPLPLWNQNEGHIDAARARAERKRLESVALSAGIQHEARAAREEMQRWSALVVELDDTLLPLAKAEVERAEEAYNSGQGDIQSVFRARDKFFQLARARLDALRAYHLARARFNAANAKP